MVDRTLLIMEKKKSRRRSMTMVSGMGVVSGMRVVRMVMMRKRAAMATDWMLVDQERCYCRLEHP